MGYIEQLIKLGKIQVIRDKERGRPSISEMTICHDDWCGIFKGKGCNCEPEITQKEVK